jgi:nucleoside 2-deoxyribosyltransferase
MKKKIYIAGPMSGKECYNFEEFFVVARILKNAGYEVINPAQIDAEKMFDGWQYTEDQYPLVLSEDITVITNEAFMVVLLDGWEESKGACVEKAFAEAIGLPVVKWSYVQADCEGMPFDSPEETIQGIIKAVMEES